MISLGFSCNTPVSSAGSELRKPSVQTFRVSVSVEEIGGVTMDEFLDDESKNQAERALGNRV